MAYIVEMKKVEEKQMKEECYNFTVETKTKDMAKIGGGCLRISADL